MLRSSFRAMRVALTESRANGVVCIHSFLVLVDLDDGMSVTNDIENVLAELLASGEFKPGHMRLVYRDTERIYDEVVTDPRGAFVGFRSLGRARARTLALTRAIGLQGLQ